MRLKADFMTWCLSPVWRPPVEEIEQMSSLFQQKQRELVAAVSKVEELSRQLEMLKNGRIEALNDSQSSVAELDRLYKELQVGRGTPGLPGNSPNAFGRDVLL